MIRPSTGIAPLSHWDIVLHQEEQNGGGEIWFDEVLIRKNGRFVLKRTRRTESREPGRIDPPVDDSGAGIPCGPACLFSVLGTSTGGAVFRTGQFCCEPAGVRFFSRTHRVLDETLPGDIHL